MNYPSAIDQDVFDYIAKLFADEITSFQEKVDKASKQVNEELDPEKLLYDLEWTKRDFYGDEDANDGDKDGRASQDHFAWPDFGHALSWDSFPPWPGKPGHGKPDDGHGDRPGKDGDPYEGLKDIEGRTLDGTGNNVENPDWGSAFHNYIRVTPASYPDGVGDVMRLDPEPRDITNAIMAQPKDENGEDIDIPNAAGMNEFLQFFGQYLTHDVAEAEIGNPQTSQAVPLEGLPFPFFRTPDHDVEGTDVRQHENEETSFLDLSTVYGKSEDMLNLLRAKTTDSNGNDIHSARLLTGSQDNLLPTFAEVAAHHGLNSAEEAIDVLAPLAAAISPESYAAGDDRVNQQAPLITHHVLWLRNHNWHVEDLEKTFPEWSQEELFEAARAMNEAEWQRVVYDEYVTKLLGEDALSKYSGYDEKVDPSIIHEWATVAFRFGHDQSSNDLRGLEEDGSEAFLRTLGEAFALANNAEAVRDADSLRDWIRGQLARHTQEIDGKVVEGNRNVLFGIPGPDGEFLTVDLEVLDIQRGRDHGVGDYNKLREGLDLSTYDSFEAFAAANNVDDETLQALKDVYDDDISTLDSIVGGLLEKKAEGSQLGETFTILNVMQFENLRDGDRHFYLERFKDNPELIAQIERTSLADIIQRNTDIEYVYHDAFAAHERIGGGSDHDKLSGTDGADLIMGFAGNDILRGKADDDDLYGGDGNDWLFGGHGDDIMNGGRGDDVLVGIKGQDTFVFEQDSGKDKVFGFSRNDKLDLSDYGFSSIKEVKAAASPSLTGTTIALSEDGDKVELVGVKLKWLDEDNFILDQDTDGFYA